MTTSIFDDVPEIELNITSEPTKPPTITPKLMRDVRKINARIYRQSRVKLRERTKERLRRRSRICVVIEHTPTSAQYGAEIDGTTVTADPRYVEKDILRWAREHFAYIGMDALPELAPYGHHKSVLADPDDTFIPALRTARTILVFGHMKWHPGPYEYPQDGDEEFEIDVVAIADPTPRGRRVPRSKAPARARRLARR